MDPRANSASTSNDKAAANLRSERQGVGIELKEVVREFAKGGGAAKSVKAVDHVTLSVSPGEFVAFLGPSGCGKSTLLRLIAGLDRADSGQVILEGITKRQAAEDGQSPIAFVFQDAHLLPWRSVLRNVALPLELAGVGRRLRLEKARAALAEVGLSDAVDRYPAQLSGGMRMRVSLARALVTQPRLLLLDEPFAALDELTRQRLDEGLYQLWKVHQPTVLFVTHSISEAAYLSQRVLVFSTRPARIVLDHALALPADRPASLRTEPVFASEARRLHEALVKGGA